MKMLLVRLRFFFLSRAICAALLHFITYVAWFWLIISVGTHFYKNELDWHSPILLVAGCAVALLVAMWRTFPRTKCAIYSKASKTHIEIKVGDLLEESCHLVIGVNDCFDTQLPQIISENSIQGKFLIRRYSGRQDLLDKEIGEALDGLRGQVDATKQFGKSTRYPVGSVAVLGTKTKAYLVAFTEMRCDTTTETTTEFLWASLCALWRSVRRTANLAPVSMPVLGAGLGRAKASWLTLAVLSIASFAMMTREEIISTKLTLLVYPGDYRPEDFAFLCTFLKKLDF